MPFINKDDSFFLVIDTQDRLLKLLNDYEPTVKRIKLLTEATRLLEIPVVATEHNPMVFGDTEQELRKHIPEPPMVKFCFSCFGLNEFKQRVAYLNKKTVIVAGYEAHICVLQSIIDAISQGFKVFAVSDAIGAVNKQEHQIALRRYAEEDATVTTSESIIFELIRDSQAKSFKKTLPILKRLRAIT